MHFRFNGVSERDMDILFLEEFAVNRYFLQLFLRKIEDVDFSGYEVVSEEVSFADPDLGESDLTIDLEKERHRVSLLIEDKTMRSHSQDNMSDMWNAEKKVFGKITAMSFMYF